METDGVIAEILVVKFYQLFNKSLQEIIYQNEKIALEKSFKRQIEKENIFKNVNPQNFIVLKELYKGPFGPILLTKYEYDNSLYVLKVNQRKIIEQKNVEKYFLDQKKMLQQLNFPFLIKLYSSFISKHYIILITEYINGKQLFQFIRQVGSFTTDQTQFYIAAIITLLEFFYKKNIIHRDIKPQNFMVDQKGYLKLIDLGIAKCLKTTKSTTMLTFTVIGTPHYMAPQVFLGGKGYSYYADLWSLGICLYQFTFGNVPFGQNIYDPYQIYQAILNKQVYYPKNLKDKKVKKFIDQLLNKTNPEARLGGSYHALKSHTWFDGFDWKQFMQKKMKPPIYNTKNMMIEKQINELQKNSISFMKYIEKSEKNKNILRSIL